MPKRFALEYTNEKGEKAEPVVIHRASIGAIERTKAFLLEKYKGALPLWLSPVQVALIPIAERHVAAAQKMADDLKAAGIRVEVDDRSEPMGAKIRFHTLQKVPFMGIIGDREVEGNHISLRSRKGEDLKSQSLESFLSLLKDQLEHRI